MKIKRVFLSSVGRSLEAHRDAAYAAINGLDGYKCVRMEDFGARDSCPADFCRQCVRSCDVFVGIVGPFYGSHPPDDETSFTEIEFDAAAQKGMSRFIFLTAIDFMIPSNIRDTDEEHKRLEAFRERVRPTRISDSFKSPAELKALVLQALTNSQPGSSEFQAYCVPTFARAEGHTERIGDLRITAYGAKRPEKVDVTLRLSTYVTNYIDGLGTVDVSLTSERRGVLARGRLDGAAGLVFEGASLDQASLEGDEVLTISGVRVSAALANGQTIDAELKIREATAEKRILFSVLLTVAMIPAPISFSVEKVPNNRAAHLGVTSADEIVRCFVVEFTGSFATAFRTKAEETCASGRAADHGTAVSLYAQVGGDSAKNLRVFATLSNLTMPADQHSFRLPGMAVLMETNAFGNPSARSSSPPYLMWDGQIPMAEAKSNRAAWEIVETLTDSERSRAGFSPVAKLRFGCAIVGPKCPGGLIVWFVAGFSPSFSTAAVHLPSCILPIPRFRAIKVHDAVRIALD